MNINANATSFKPIIFNYSIEGYSTYSVYVNGYKILDENGGRNGVKTLPPFIKKGDNVINIIADNNSNAPEPKFLVRLSNNSTFPSSDINSNTGNLITISAAGNMELGFVVTDDVYEASWDKTCDQSAALGKFVELNNAYAAKDSAKVSELLAYKAKLEAEENGTTELAELVQIKESVAAIGSDLQNLTQENYAQHVKFEVIKDSELYKIQSLFTVDGMSVGIESYIGCVSSQPTVLF